MVVSNFSLLHGTFKVVMQRLKGILKNINIMRLFFVGTFVVLGVTSLLFTSAATLTASFEAESGTRTGGVSAVTDPAASGGGAIKFEPQSVSGACPAFPSFPDTSCTGVPAGTSLISGGDFATTSNGQTITDRLINGDLVLEHNNVTVTNSRIKGRVWAHGHSGLTLRNVDLGPDSCAASPASFATIAQPNGFTLIQTRVHHNAADLIQIGGGQPVLIQDSMLDSTCFYDGAHLDAFQYYDPGGVVNASIIHSVLDSRPVNIVGLGNAAIQWGDFPGSGTVFTLYHNKFAGGNYTTQLNDASIGSGVLIDAHDNVYVKNSYQYGPCTSGGSNNFNGTYGLKFVNNTLDDGTPVSC